MFGRLGSVWGGGSILGSTRADPGAGDDLGSAGDCSGPMRGDDPRSICNCVHDECRGEVGGGRHGAAGPNAGRVGASATQPPDASLHFWAAGAAVRLRGPSSRVRAREARAAREANVYEEAPLRPRARSRLNARALARRCMGRRGGFLVPPGEGGACWRGCWSLLVAADCDISGEIRVRVWAKTCARRTATPGQNTSAS